MIWGSPPGVIEYNPNRPIHTIIPSILVIDLWFMHPTEEETCDKLKEVVPDPG